MGDAAEWLSAWAEGHVDSAKHVDAKAEVHDAAKACVEAGIAAGYSVAELKAAAGGDVEHYLMDVQNARAG